MAFTSARLCKRVTTGLFTLALAGSCGAVLGAPKPSAPADPWRVVSTTNGNANKEPIASIKFANGQVFTPHLFSPAVIGVLASGRAVPYLVVDGAECTECDATARSVYVGDPTAWPRDFAKDGWAIGFPSRNYSATTGKLMSWSRLFIGRCVGELPTVISFYASYEEKGWSRGVDWVEVVGDRLVAHAADAKVQGAPTVAEVLKSVRAGRCREVHAQTTDEGDYG